VVLLFSPEEEGKTTEDAEGAEEEESGKRRAGLEPCAPG
jgi:hypothetical protein